jgi:hypothetical protein
MPGCGPPEFPRETSSGPAIALRADRRCVAVLLGPQLAEHVENQTAGAKLEPKVLENLAVVCMRWLETPCLVCDTWYMANSLWADVEEVVLSGGHIWAYSCC